jgi:hypothetical protein
MHCLCKYFGHKLQNSDVCFGKSLQNRNIDPCFHEKRDSSAYVHKYLHTYEHIWLTWSYWIQTFVIFHQNENTIPKEK